MTEHGQLTAADREHIDKLMIFFGQQAKTIAFPSAPKSDAEILELELDLAATEMTRLFLDNPILQNEVQAKTKNLVHKYASHHIVDSVSDAFEDIENFLEAARMLAARTNPVAKRNYDAAAGKQTQTN